MPQNMSLNSTSKIDVDSSVLFISTPHLVPSAMTKTYRVIQEKWRNFVNQQLFRQTTRPWRDQVALVQRSTTSHSLELSTVHSWSTGRRWTLGRNLERRRAPPDNLQVALTGSHLVRGARTRVEKPISVDEYIWSRVNGKAIGRRLISIPATARWHAAGRRAGRASLAKQDGQPLNVRRRGGHIETRGD